MADMLVKLYDLPDCQDEKKNLNLMGFDVRRPLAPEKHLVLDWVRKNFNDGWASECDAAFSRYPVSCFIAVKDGKIAGFACYDCICADFFGPTGVEEALRGKGIGKVLLLSCLEAMRALGYGYAIIGSVGPQAFYKKAVGAIEIPDSKPGIYKGMMDL